MMNEAVGLFIEEFIEANPDKGTETHSQASYELLHIVYRS